MLKQLLICIALCTVMYCKDGPPDLHDKFKDVRKAALVDSLIKCNAHEGQFEGLTGNTTEQWFYYEQLSQRYSEKELTELCNNKNPIVRCFAFQALADNCSDKVFEILLNHLSDTAEFQRLYGCMSGTDRVSDNFLDAVGYDKRGLNTLISVPGVNALNN